jgi:phage tail-like protein
MMANGTDPYRNYNFKLDIAGMTVGHFTECSGLGVRVDPITYREAGNQSLVRHIPGRLDYSPITLRYGLTDSAVLWDWMQSTVAGNVERKNVSVILLDSAGDQEVMRWNLVDAWPSEWQGAGLDALDSEIAIENLTLVFDSLERA